MRYIWLARGQCARTPEPIPVGTSSLTGFGARSFSDVVSVNEVPNTFMRQLRVSLVSLVYLENALACFERSQDPPGSDVINIQLPITHALSLVTYNKASVSSEYLFSEEKGW